MVHKQLELFEILKLDVNKARRELLASRMKEIGLNLDSDIPIKTKILELSVPEGELRKYQTSMDLIKGNDYYGDSITTTQKRGLLARKSGVGCLYPIKIDCGKKQLIEFSNDEIGRTYKNEIRNTRRVIEAFNKKYELSTEH